jgi:hypothetical protein
VRPLPLGFRLKTISEENQSMHVKRLWRFAIRALFAASYVAGSQVLAQVSLDLRESCARQAEIVFRDRGYSKGVTRPKEDNSGRYDVIANFESHYNTELNRCFMLLEIFGVGASNAGFQIRSLFDAYEGRTYAEFAWGPAEDKKYFEVRPYCRLMSSRDDQSNCRSEAEFNAFITRYME